MDATRYWVFLLLLIAASTLGLLTAQADPRAAVPTGEASTGRL